MHTRIVEVTDFLPLVDIAKFNVLNDAVELGIAKSGKKSNDADSRVVGGYRRSIHLVMVARVKSKILIKLHTPFNAASPNMQGVLIVGLAATGLTERRSNLGGGVQPVQGAVQPEERLCRS